MQNNNAVACAGAFQRIRKFVRSNFRRNDGETVFHIILSNTNICIDIGNGFTTHGKVKDYDTVATKNSLKGQLMITFLRNIKTILAIGFTFADLCTDFCRNSLMQRKDQNSCIFTGVGVFAKEIVSVRVIVGFSTHLPIKLGTTGVHHHFGIVAMVDGEMQVSDAVAAGGKTEHLFIIARNCVNAVIPLVGATVLHRLIAFRNRIDREMQNHDAITPIDSGQIIGGGSQSRCAHFKGIVNFTVHIVVREGIFADEFKNIHCIGKMNCEAQRHGAVATFGIGEGLRINT